MEEKVITENPPESKEFSVDGLISTQRFAALNHLIMRDLNGVKSAPTFSKFSKDEIAQYLSNPYQYQKNLRNAAIYIYGSSSHFRRLINYFAGLSDLSYVLSPYKLDTGTANPKTVNRNYRKCANLLSAMDIKNQWRKILTVCLREDSAYYTLWTTSDNITLQQLPSDYCDIASIEGNVCNVSFDFSYFDSHSTYLPYYPPEFSEKYEMYKNNRIALKWQDLDSPTSFAIKCNSDILNYSIPPFAGILREIYDLEDYKALKMSKTELENYALLCMKLGMDADGNWTMDLEKAKEFYRNLDAVLPSEVGALLTPMPIEKISFERTQSGDTETVADAEQNIFSAAGVSSLLFNNEKASSNALMLSIKCDQAITYGIVCSIEQAINRFLWAQPYGKNCKVTFLDCSPYNRKELSDGYLKAAQYGLPTISYYAAAQGMSQMDLDGLNFLEDRVLDLKNRLIPLKSSSTMSSGDPGAPKKSIGEISDNGESAGEHSGDES